jgi:hypothetical protein
LVGQQGGLDLAPGVIGGQLAQELGAPDAAQDEVEAVIGEALVVDDAAHTQDLVYRESAVVVFLVAWAQDRDGQGEVVLQDVPGHLAVAGLEDVERQQGVGEQGHPRQREDREALELVGL